jgi:hypothetical protein
MEANSMSTNQELIPTVSQNNENSQSSITKQLISNLQKLREEDVRELNITIKNGTQRIEVNLADGSTLTQTRHPSGISERSMTQIPDFDSIEDRNHAIKEQYKQRKTQEELARLFGLSQTTIHNILKKQ